MYSNERLMDIMIWENFLGVSETMDNRQRGCPPSSHCSQLRDDSEIVGYIVVDPETGNVSVEKAPGNP